MNNILENLMAQLGGNETARMSQTLGADRAATQQAMSAALPLLLTALAKNASKPEGAEALHRALAKDHDGSLLDNLGGFLDRPDTKTGDGILRHVLGDRRVAVEAAIGKASGLDARGTASMLTTLAPLVMGMLGRAQRQQNLDAGSLARLLQGEQRVAAKAPALGGLAALLDRDNDGQIADDLAKLGGGLLGGLFGGRSRK